MKRIGLILKEAREDQGLSLEEASRRTKIHINKLMAIESNDFNNLPAKVFVKGLIRSYARELKVDQKTVQELCDKEFEEQAAEVPSPAPISSNPIEDEDNEKRPVGRFQAPNSFFIFVGLLIASILITFIYITVSKINSYSKEETATQAVELLDEKPIPIEKIADEKDIDESKSNDSVKALDPKKDFETEKKKKDLSKEEKTTKVALTAQQLADQIEPPINKKTKASVKKEKISIEKKQEEALSKITKTKDEAPKVVSVKEDKPQKTSTVYSDNKLVVEAIEAVRVEITWSDGKPQVILMKEKEKKTFIFSNPLKVSINNGGAVNIYYNNKFLGVPGSLNTPIELKYP